MDVDEEAPGPLPSAPVFVPPPPKQRTSSFIYQPERLEQQSSQAEILDKLSPLGKLDCAHAKAVVRKMVDKLQLLNALPVDIVKRVRRK